MDISVNNSNQSFGMAFIRPKKSDVIEHFYRVNKKRIPKSELIEQGMQQLEKEHLNDAYFDFMYNEGAFQEVFGLDTVVIRPKSVISKDFAKKEVVTVPSACHIGSKFDGAIAKFKTEMERILEIKSPVRRFFAELKLRHDVSKEINRIVKNPKELLPDNLRYASELVKEKEKSMKHALD